MWLFLSLVWLVAIVVYEKSRRSRVRVTTSVASYVPPVVLPGAAYCQGLYVTPAELRFFCLLDAFVAGRARIMSKVRLADLAIPTVAPYSSTWQSAFNRVACKHVDFLLTDKYLTPLLVVELDDKSHEQYARIKRDDFVDTVLNGAGLPVIHVSNSVFTEEQKKTFDRILNKR